MITLKDVLNYAILKGFDYEIEAPQSYAKYAGRDEIVNQYNSKEFYKFKIGINTRDFIWIWFEFFPLETEDLRLDHHVRFVERYSQNTGKSIKSFKYGWKVESKIKAVMKDLF